MTKFKKGWIALVCFRRLWPRQNGYTSPSAWAWTACPFGSCLRSDANINHTESDQTTFPRSYPTRIYAVYLTCVLNLTLYFKYNSWQWLTVQTLPRESHRSRRIGILCTYWVCASHEDPGQIYTKALIQVFVVCSTASIYKLGVRKPRISWPNTPKGSLVRIFVACSTPSIYNSKCIENTSYG